MATPKKVHKAPFKVDVVDQFQGESEKIRTHFGDKVFKTLIRGNISLAEAPSFGKSIFEYRPDSHGAEDYLTLCEGILRKEGL
jgi:cellulose biosynthesis protein BcsQ